MAVAAVSFLVPPCAFPQTDAAAKVVALTGQVSILRDSQPWILNVGDSVNPRQIIVTGQDGFAQFRVSDGSTFEVYPNSRLIFRDTPGNWKDLLDVLIGRVKVHIQKLDGRPNNNRVRTPTAVISVRGTVFDVDVEDQDATTLVLVEEGQVAVEHSLLPRGAPKVLNAGEWLRVYRNQPLAAKRIDKGSVVQGAFRAAAEAMWTVLSRTSQSPGGGSGPVPAGGGGAPLPGDTSSDPPPAPPPPPPPPPN